VVVAVGLTVVEPVAVVAVKVPGAMATVVAPVTDQVSVVLAPEFMVVGLAVKEVIDGAEGVPEVDFGMIEPQPARQMMASGIRSIAHRWTQERRRCRGLRLFVGNELGEFMQAVSLRRAYFRRA
jgi:hypothetical protein